MAKLKFTHYMHDNDFYETTLEIHDEIGGENATGLNDDDFAQAFGRPFYEVKLECEFDTVTQETTILSAVI